MKYLIAILAAILCLALIPSVSNADAVGASGEQSFPFPAYDCAVSGYIYDDMRPVDFQGNVYCGNLDLSDPKNIDVYIQQLSGGIWYNMKTSGWSGWQTNDPQSRDMTYQWTTGDTYRLYIYGAVKVGSIQENASVATSSWIAPGS